MQLQFQFDSITDFFAMGNYGFYVWLAYGVSFAAMGWLIWQSKREQKQIQTQVKKELAREAQMKK
nr:heme exporter protein CcmD [uncultured Haemophilus sp.]